MIPSRASRQYRCLHKHAVPWRRLPSLLWHAEFRFRSFIYFNSPLLQQAYKTARPEMCPSKKFLFFSYFSLFSAWLRRSLILRHLTAEVLLLFLLVFPLHPFQQQQLHEATMQYTYNCPDLLDRDQVGFVNIVHMTLPLTGFTLRPNARWRVVL